jgi:hypothetical protein
MKNLNEVSPMTPPTLESCQHLNLRHKRLRSFRGYREAPIAATESRASIAAKKGIAKRLFAKDRGNWK